MRRPELHRLETVSLSWRTETQVFIGERDLWGRGIGQAVIAQMLAALNEVGITHVAIDTASHNHRAIGLYHKMGFEMERVLKKWENEHHHVVMIRRGREACNDKYRAVRGDVVERKLDSIDGLQEYT